MVVGDSSEVKACMREKESERISAQGASLQARTVNPSDIKESAFKTTEEVYLPMH